MNLISFLEEVFLPNIFLYFMVLLAVSFIVGRIMKKFAQSIFDPLFYRLVLMIFAYSIPVFLFCTKNMGLEHFLYFVLSETSFWIGFILLSEKQIYFANSKFRNENDVLKYLFYFSVVIFVVGTIYTYIVLGIPLFLSNRNDVYKGSGGLGFLSYLLGFSSNYILIYSFYKLLIRRYRVYIFFILLILVTTFLNGSKGGVMNICFCYFYFSFFYLKQKISLKKKYYLYIVACPILILIIASSSDFLDAFQDLIVRFIASGDIYWSSYPDNVIDNIKVEQPLKHLFIGLLGPLRLVSYDTFASEPIGLLVNWYVNPEYEILGMTTAPNSPTAIISWVYYRWSGLLLSFLIGCFASALIYKSSKFFPKSLLGIILYSSVYSAGVSFVTDPGMAISSIFTIIFNFVLYGIIAVIVTPYKNHTRHDESKI